MQIKIKKLKVITAILMQVLLILFFVPAVVQAQDARIYVEVRVYNDDEGGHGSAYGAAMSFIDTMDLKGLESLKPSDSGFVDPKILKKFLPPPLKGSYDQVEIYDGPEIKRDGLVPYVHVDYARGPETPWDDVDIAIKYAEDGHSSMRSMHLKSEYRKYTDSTTIKGYDATIFRAPFGGGGHEVQITVAIPVQGVINWINVCVAALNGTRKGVQIWSASARFTTGTINASVLTIPSGSLEGSNFTESIISEIMTLDVPVQIAEAFAAPVWSGWNKWSVTFAIHSFSAFPSFVAFPGPSAPPTSALPIPLSAAAFNRDLLKANALKVQILSRLGKWKEDPEAKRAVERFSEWLDESFTSAITKSQITNLMGQGPVPTFAPPEVPSGPVVGGSIIPSPGCFANLQF